MLGVLGGAGVLGVVLPVFLCAGVGWVWVHLGQSFDRGQVSRLISDVGAPCLVFSSLVGFDPGSEQIAQMAGAALLVLAGSAVVAWPILRASGLPAHTFLPPVVFGNAGNMGLPICLFAFGEEGLALAVCFFAVTAITHFTLGVLVWSGHASPAEWLRTPLVYAVVAALSVLGTDVALPVWLTNTTTLLGGFTIPLMLLALGASLHELRVADLRRSLALSVLRLGLGLGLGLAVAAGLGLEGEARAIVIILSAMPVAVFNYLFAERYGRRPQAVASLVVLSTLLAFVELPFLLGWLLAS